MNTIHKNREMFWLTGVNRYLDHEETWTMKRQMTNYLCPRHILSKWISLLHFKNLAQRWHYIQNTVHLFYTTELFRIRKLNIDMHVLDIHVDVKGGSGFKIIHPLVHGHWYLRFSFGLVYFHNINISCYPWTYHYVKNSQNDFRQK